MVKNEPVSLTRQTIYCIIPILDIYAAYRVKSLRKYLAIMLLVGIPISIVDGFLFPIEDSTWEGFYQFLTFYYGVNWAYFAKSVAITIGTILLAIYLIRRWSKHWNTKFLK